MSRRHPFAKTALTSTALVAAALALQVSPAFAGDKLTLRVNDAEGRPGGRVGVVVRTYAPRDIDEGQICLRSAPSARSRTLLKSAGGPFAALEEVVVLSEAGDVTSAASFEDVSQVALAGFFSPSGTINHGDGPMAIFYFRLRDDVVPDEEYGLELDLDNTFLVPADGEAVGLRLRGGKLKILRPHDPRGLAVAGDQVAPGEMAELGITTGEGFAVGSGEVALLYDPAVGVGSPAVAMGGDAIFTVDSSVPGLVRVAFESAGEPLNSAPGRLITIFLQVSASAPPDTFSPLILDPDATRLEGEDGAPIPLSLEQGVLVALD